MATSGALGRRAFGIASGVREPTKEASPIAGVADSQSVKATESQRFARRRRLERSSADDTSPLRG